MDNLDPVTPDNPDPVVEPVTPVATEPVVPSMTWKNNLSPDLQGSPLMEKFEDTAEGLNKAFESHNNLEKLLGHEKVPIPKGPEDVEGWNRFSKAMGIPDKAENYGLANAVLPESLKGITIDKGKFAEVMHAHKATPAQAKGMWEAYQAINIETYNRSMEAHQKKLNDTVNMLKSEWGDTYAVNVELGQTVINKFSLDQETNDFITSALSSDPKGIKFLAKIGEQFAESNITEFQMKRFSLAPEEAQEEINKMTRDLNGPYMNTNGKFTEAEHQAAIDRVNSLREMIIRNRG